MRFRTLLVFAALVTLVPVQVEGAERSWWAWLEELSGPGYFTGPMFTFNLTCLGSPTGCGNFKPAAPERNTHVKKSINLTIGRLSSGHRPRFKDVPPAGADDPNRKPVIAWPVHMTLLWRVHRALDIGPGAGALIFSGAGVQDHARLILIPVSASWKPALTKASWPNRRLTRAFSIDFETYYITKGFNGASFGNSTTQYSSGPQLQGIIGVSFDFGEAIRK